MDALEIAQTEGVEHLARSAQLAADGYFTPDALSSIPLEERQKRGLGIQVSKWAKWDGMTVLDVCFSALEDCNYHREAGIVAELIAIHERGV